MIEMKNYKLIILTTLPFLACCGIKKDNSLIQENNNVERSTAPKITILKNMVIEKGSEFVYTDYLAISDNANVTVSPIDTEVEGEHQMQVVAENNGSYTVRNLKVTVEKKEIVCQENATYDEQAEECICNSGYQDNGNGGCDVIPTPKPVYKPAPPAPTPTPYVEQYQEPQEPAGQEYFYADNYGGSYDAAFNACVVRCQSFGNCSCDPTGADDGYVLSHW